VSANSFRELRQAIAARQFLSDEGGLVGYSLDLLKDAFVERTRLGLLIRFPEQDPRGTSAPDDALSAMGRDRRVVRGLSETSASYVKRLKAWLDDRKTAGNAYALMQRLAEYLGTGTSFRVVDNAGNWYSRDVSGNRTLVVGSANWNWDGLTAQWSRFWVIIYPGALWTRTPAWGAGGTVWGSTTGSLGSTATLQQIETLRALIADWKPAGTTCVNMIVAFGGASFSPLSPEPDGTWGPQSRNVAGVQVPTRLSTALYWDGV
jgi:hypothetical protein